MRPNAHAITNRRLVDLLLLAVLGGTWLACAGCEERGSTRAQALANDIVLRIRALDPPTLTPAMMPPEPLTRDLLLETTTLAGFEPTLGGERRIMISKPPMSDFAIHPHKLEAFNDNVSFAVETATREGEMRGADGGSLSLFFLMFSRPHPGDEQVLSAVKLDYKNYRICDAIERSFAETPTHGLCSRRLIPEAGWLKRESVKRESKIYPEWYFCAATPSRRDLVWIECSQVVETGDSFVTYNIIKRPEGELGEKAAEKAAYKAAEKAAEKAAAEKAVADKAAADKAAAEKSTPGYVKITAGSFKMGSPSSEDGHLEYAEAQHEVTLTRDYFMKATEVTQGEWRALMGNNPSDFTNCGDNCPVENVSWYDGLAYSNALSASEGLEECYDLSGCSGTPGEGNYTCPDDLVFDLSCEGYRLPTEAEWEYAARAGTQTRFSSGDDDSDLMRVAWYSDNSDSKTHRVGEKDANAWGLYDMHGNVREWTWDWYDDYLSGATTDPMGSPSGPYRVGRGGGWWYRGARLCRAAARIEISPSDRSNKLGFRPVRSSP